MDKPDIVNPSESKTTTEKAAAALSTVSSNVDPFPHYLLAGLCQDSNLPNIEIDKTHETWLGGSGGLFAYTMKNHNAALIAGGLALAYLYSG